MMVGLALMISTIPDKGSKVVTKEGLQEHISKRGHPECVMEKVREHFDKADQDLLLEKTLHDIGFACLQRQAVAKQKKELLGNEG